MENTNLHDQVLVPLHLGLARKVVLCELHEVCDSLCESAIGFLEIDLHFLRVGNEIWWK